MRYWGVLLFWLSPSSPGKKLDAINAEIVGIDNRMIPCLGSDTCNCPGGIYITIDNVTALNGHSFKAKLYPHNFKYTAPFPIAVKIDWEYDTIPCGGNRIDILKIAKR